MDVSQPAFPQGISVGTGRRTVSVVGGGHVGSATMP